MKFSRFSLLIYTYLFLGISGLSAQNESLLSIKRLFNSPEFRQEYAGQTQWLDGGNAYTKIEGRKNERGKYDLVGYDCDTQESRVLVTQERLIPKGQQNPLRPAGYSWSHDQRKLLIFTNTRRVWRSNTKGDYWVLNMDNWELRQIGASLPEASLMFAKFSPNDEEIAYVSEFNIYRENLGDGKIEQLTTDGTTDIINGTFDWVYEEELSCRDGFRWSPDGQKIAFWQLNASTTRNFYMINNTDSIYSQMIPVQYPKVGEQPSAAKIGVIDLNTKDIKEMRIPGAPDNNYLPRLQWLPTGEMLVQQLNRKQNQLTIWQCNPNSGIANQIYVETDEAWVDLSYPDVSATSWAMKPLMTTKDGNYFFRLSEKDGWRHLWKVSMEGEEKLLTEGEYDVATVYGMDEERGYIYFSASPDNSTQRYLYRVKTDGSKAKRLTPKEYVGVNRYVVSPNGKFALHTHSSVNQAPTVRLVELPSHQTLQTLVKNEKLMEKVNSLARPTAEFFTVKTEDNISVDGLMFKPHDFDPNKKYPVLFHVYGEPWGAVATNSWPRLWHVMLAQFGYVVIAMDNRGTPCLKGREWRKSIYRKIGVINARDQAMAAKEVLKWKFIDPARTAVWGWSGGGSMTLNLMFRYPDIYTTGMSVAPVANQLYYDNIYQERYMGLPSENREDFIEGSPITYAHQLKGNLLLVHGTADDNVHYQNAEALINKLIEHNKQFQVMPYPNRSHGIYEGKNTTRHLYTLLTNYLMQNVKPGGE